MAGDVLDCGRLQSRETAPYAPSPDAEAWRRCKDSRRLPPRRDCSQSRSRPPADRQMRASGSNRRCRPIRVRPSSREPASSHCYEDAAGTLPAHAIADATGHVGGDEIVVDQPPVARRFIERLDAFGPHHGKQCVEGPIDLRELHRAKRKAKASCAVHRLRSTGPCRVSITSIAVASASLNDFSSPAASRPAPRHP